jgi:Na+:H+ antiporter
MDRVELFGSAVFIPIFVVSIGLLLDPSVISRERRLVLPP